MSGFYHKHFLKLLDFAPAELNSSLQLTAKLKTDKKSGKEEARSTGKNTALIFEKNSTCARHFFEVAAYDQGARATYLGPSGGQIGHKGSTKDTVRVSGRIYDGIQYCGYGQEIAGTLAEYADIPVWNGLTDEFHLAQLLANLLTMQEHLPGKASDGMTLVYAGDVCSSMGDSMPEATAPTGLDLCPAASQACWSEAALVVEYSVLAQKHGGKITLTEDIASGVKGADFICTDAWVPMGGPRERRAERITLLCDHQVNSKIMALIGNSQVKFLHCLSTFHDEQTTLGKKMATEFGLYSGMGVIDEVFESPVSIIFDQTENRMHTIETATVATLAK